MIPDHARSSYGIAEATWAELPLDFSLFSTGTQGAQLDVEPNAGCIACKGFDRHISDRIKNSRLK